MWIIKIDILHISPFFPTFIEAHEHGGGDRELLSKYPDPAATQLSTSADL